MKKRPSTQATRVGLTLIEVIVSLLLVSTILLVCITASASLIRNRTLARDSLIADNLLGQFLDEVSVRDYYDPGDVFLFGIEPDEDAADRSTLDDVDDYHQYEQTSPTYRDGTPIPGFEGWTIDIIVQRAQPEANGISIVTDDRSPLRLVTVSSTSPSGRASSDSILVSSVPTNVPADQSYERMRRAEFTFSDGRNLSISSPLRNQPSGASN